LFWFELNLYVIKWTEIWIPDDYLNYCYIHLIVTPSPNLFLKAK